jgi:hypothetical protein
METAHANLSADHACHGSHAAHANAHAALHQHKTQLFLQLHNHHHFAKMVLLIPLSLTAASTEVVADSAALTEQTISTVARMVLTIQLALSQLPHQ